MTAINAEPRSVADWKLEAVNAVYNSDLSQRNKMVLAAMVQSGSFAREGLDAGKLVFRQRVLDLGFSIGYNPPTIAKAWKELEAAGYIQRLNAKGSRPPWWEINHAELIDVPPF